MLSNEPWAHELSDGRLAMTMMGVRGVVVADFATGRADTVGRKGEGPGEFAGPGAVVPWSTGRYAVIDQVLARITVFKEPAKFDRIIPVPPGHQVFTAVPRSNGVWYSSGAPGPNASMPLLRSVGPNGQRDTIARLAWPRTTMTPIGHGTAIRLAPEYAARDVWGVLPDGRLWIARGVDNRIDWFSADGKLTRGRPRTFPVIRTVDADKHKYRGMPAIPAIDTVRRAIAPVKAPFQEVVAGSNGELWVWLNQPAGYKTERYQRVSARGVVLSELELPLAQKILAVGKSHLYVMSMNADDEIVISRHAKPASL